MTPLLAKTKIYISAANEIDRRVHEALWIHINEQTKDDYEKTILLLFSQIRTRYFCSLRLVELSFVQEATLLTRSLFELVLNIEYIKIGGEIKAKQFLDFVVFEQYRMFERNYRLALKDNPAEALLLLDKMKELEPQFKAIKRKFITSKHGKEKDFESWHNLKIRNLAEVIDKNYGGENYLFSYETLYRHSSGITHGSPVTAYDATIFSVVDFKSENVHQYACWIIIENMTLYNMALGVLIETFQWMPKEIYTDTAKKIVQLTKKEFPSCPSYYS